MSYIGSKPANKPVVASDLDPTVITGQTALATSPADTDEFLISDAGVLKRLDASLVGGGGKVLQVITATDSTQRATTSTSYTKASNSLDVVITPAATSSKLLLMYTGEFASDGSTVTIVTIFRNTTNLETSSGAGMRAANVTTASAISITHLDSPSSTSELTYSIQFRGNSGGQARLESNSRPASFTVMEIGA